MARDKTARENETESLLDRRSYLKMAVAAAASVAAVGASTGSVDAASYDTIKVSAGSTRTFSVGAGETFENKLIDITADGAHFRIQTSGSGWTIRNIGVKGANDDTSDTRGCIYCRADDGGEGLVENIYLGDGGGSRTHHAPITGYGNAGHVTIRNVHIQGWGADGMYLSQPGVPANFSSQGGTFTVEGCYAKNNNIENMRIGTPGSVIRDSVVHVEGKDAVNANESGQKNPRGIWFKEQGDLLAENCDVKVNGSYAVFQSSGGSGTLRNCRIDGNIDSSIEQENVTSGADVTPPEGVPMSPEEAASGNANQQNDSTTQEPTTEDPGSVDGPEGTVLELVANDDASNAAYEFTVDGDATKRTSGENGSESNDSVTANDDGTVTVTGLSGNGYGDSFYVNGPITSMDLDESQWTLRYDGEEVAVDDLVLPNELVIDGSNRPRVASTYTFRVSGKARKSADLGSVNAYDTVEEGQISGRTVGGKDGYRFSGQITGFSIDGPANVRVEDNS